MSLPFPQEQTAEDLELFLQLSPVYQEKLQPLDPADLRFGARSPSSRRRTGLTRQRSMSDLGPPSPTVGRKPRQGAGRRGSTKSRAETPP